MVSASNHVKVLVSQLRPRSDTPSDNNRTMLRRRAVGWVLGSTFLWLLALAVVAAGARVWDPKLKINIAVSDCGWTEEYAEFFDGHPSVTGNRPEILEHSPNFGVLWRECGLMSSPPPSSPPSSFVSPSTQATLIHNHSQPQSTPTPSHSWKTTTAPTARIPRGSAPTNPAAKNLYSWGSAAGGMTAAAALSSNFSLRPATPSACESVWCSRTRRRLTRTAWRTTAPGLASTACGAPGARNALIRIR